MPRHQVAPAAQSSIGSVSSPGGRAAISSAIDRLVTGWRQSGASSASGRSTKARACILGCGRTSPSDSSRIRPCQSIRSRSSTRAALRSRRRRPKAASSAWRPASASAGLQAVSTSATPLTYHGWSEGGQGGERYQRARRTTRSFLVLNCRKASSRMSRGIPYRLCGRFAPKATNIIKKTRDLYGLLSSFACPAETELPNSASAFRRPHLTISFVDRNAISLSSTRL